jgi:hypothetical protein
MKKTACRHKIKPSVCLKKKLYGNEDIELRRAAVGRDRRRRAYPNLTPGTFIKVG